jgi:hypothetical protein
VHTTTRSASAHCFVDVMGDEDHRGAALAPDIEQKALHLRSGLHVERGERLVHPV